MNQAYSEYRSPTWYGLKKIRARVKSEKEYVNHPFVMHVLSLARKRAMFENDDFWTNEICLDIELTKAIKFRKVSHYFLDEGLAEFMVSSVKEYSKDYFIPQAMPSSILHESALSTSEQAEPFFIHFPSSERLQSVGVIPYFKAPSPLLKEGGLNVFLFGARDFENIAMGSLSHNNFKGHNADDDTHFVHKLIYGFTLYIAAFPDVVREADNIKHVGHYKGHRHSVRANDIVRTEATHSVSPHFRRGHFRLLQSEKFKAKRGQAIFIKGCFVKGHAFDVLSDDGKSVGGVA